MRVGFVVPGFSANNADWCIPALRHLARALSVTDDVRVIATRYPYRSGRYSVDAVEVVALGGADRRGPATGSVWRNTLRALADEHRRRPFDVLHAFWATESGMLTALAGVGLRIPTIVSLGGGELVSLPAIGYGDRRSAWERVKVGASLRLGSMVTAGSRELQRLAERFVARRKLRYAPLGVPLDLFCPNGSVGTGLISVGTLTAVKDHATLLCALALLRREAPEVTLMVVGDGPLRAGLEQQCATLGLERAVRFTGDVDHAALPALYRTARTLVVSSVHEAQGMVALEAAACGLSVAGTRVGVIPELALPEAVAPPGDPPGLARAMLAALAHPVAPDVERFGLDACTQRFHALYAQLAQCA